MRAGQVHPVAGAVRRAEVDLAEVAVEPDELLVARMAEALQLEPHADLDAVVERGRADEVDGRVLEVLRLVAVRAVDLVDVQDAEVVVHEAGEADLDPLLLRLGVAGEERPNPHERRRAVKKLFHRSRSSLSCLW